MSNIIGWFKGLLSLANINNDYQSLSQKYSELLEAHGSVRTRLAELVREVEVLTETVNEQSCDEDLVETQINDWADANLDDRINEYIEGYDYSDIISDELRNHEFVSTDDLRNEVESALEDIDLDVDKPVRKALENEVCEEWFGEMVESEIKKAISKFESIETADNNVAIDNSIKHSIESQVVERMEAKFGEGWDTWFEEHTRYCVKNVLSQFLSSAYEQTKTEIK